MKWCGGGFRLSWGFFWFGLIFGIPLAFGQPPAKTTPPTAAAIPPGSVASPITAPSEPTLAGAPNEFQLKDALIEAEKNLTDLAPWQKTIFAEEVIPQYQRFIKDGKIDNEGLRAYLNYSAPTDGAKILIYLQGDDNCMKCQQSAPVLRALARSRLLRRGFHLIWVDPSELASAPMEEVEPTVPEKLKDLANRKEALGFLYVQWMAARGPEGKPEGVENSMSYRLTLNVDHQNLERFKEVGKTERFETVQARLLSEVFTEMGSRKPASLLSGLNGGVNGGVVVPPPLGPERIVEVSGIQQFAQLVRLKALLQSQLKDVAAVKERKISRGQVSLALSTSLSLEDLKVQLTQLTKTPAAAGSDSHWTFRVVEQE